jgi:hypothetical protein
LFHLEKMVDSDTFDNKTSQLKVSQAARSISRLFTKASANQAKLNGANGPPLKFTDVLQIIFMSVHEIWASCNLSSFSQLNVWLY